MGGGDGPHRKWTWHILVELLKVRRFVGPAFSDLHVIIHLCFVFILYGPSPTLANKSKFLSLFTSTSPIFPQNAADTQEFSLSDYVNNCLRC